VAVEGEFMTPKTGIFYKQNSGIMEISCTTRVDTIKPKLHAHSGIQFIWLENFNGDLQSDQSVNHAASSDICVIGQQIPHRLACRSSHVHTVSFLLEKEYCSDRLHQVKDLGLFSKKCDFFINNIEDLHNLTILHADKFEQDALKYLMASILQECRRMREGHEIILEGMIREFFIRILRSIPNHTVEGWSTVLDVRRYLNENMVKPFDLTQIAQEFGFNKSHLCRLFRKIQNMTMYEYLVHIRCSRALEMMKDEDFSVTAISASICPTVFGGCR